MPFVLLSLLVLAGSALGVLGLLGATAAHSTVVADSGSVRETRKVGAFDKIDAGGAFEIVVNAGAPSTSVVVEASPSVIGQITTEVQDGTLELGEKNSYTWNSGHRRVTIEVPSLSALGLSGAGSADVTNVHSQAFSVHVSGAGTVKLAGQTSSLSAELSGAANLDSVALKARSVKVSISGTGNAKVWASDKLAGDVSGVGSIRYFGNPAHVERSISGVGSIGAGS
jgi:hypothetical protein